ncbi:50S ribosomal protein L3 [candidate division WOR-3 bacterium]|nr:50S ribosomal protein L3 [candidate division WOR-3 bacterium]
MAVLLGLKGPMTQVFDDEGRAIPATTIDVSSCVVVGCRTPEKCGYTAVQLGVGRPSKRKLTKPVAGHYKQAGVEPVRHLREVRVASTEGFEPGKKPGAGQFQSGDMVDVTGWTKGRGFAGGVKRWGWKTGPRTHGNMSHRRIGSVGAGTSPGRVLKGRTLPGHYGTERVTVRKLKVVGVDAGQGRLLVTGAVPGGKGGLLVIRKRA